MMSPNSPCRSTTPARPDRQGVVAWQGMPAEVSRRAWLLALASLTLLGAALLSPTAARAADEAAAAFVRRLSAA
ncbi:MAG: hypothetical protein ACO26M_10010, partial [Limnohabitans sp.]